MMRHVVPSPVVPNLVIPSLEVPSFMILYQPWWALPLSQPRRLLPCSLVSAIEAVPHYLALATETVPCSIISAKEAVPHSIMAVSISASSAIVVFCSVDSTVVASISYISFCWPPQDPRLNFVGLLLRLLHYGNVVHSHYYEWVK